MVRTRSTLSPQQPVFIIVATIPMETFSRVRIVHFFVPQKIKIKIEVL